MKLRHVHHFDKLICAISIIYLAVVLVLALVLKDSLRTYFKSLSWSSGVRYLSLSLGGQVLVLVLVLGGQVLVNIPDRKNDSVHERARRFEISFEAQIGF